CIQTDPSTDRKNKNTPIQSIEERQIQVEACKYVDEIMIYDTEADMLEILNAVDWDIRILGDEYKNKDFTGRDETIDRCYFNSRPHTYSSTELRQRVIERSLDSKREGSSII
ncbi:MAG: glycerol-3-phosphate cytidylyltransferase, partial [Candidatus Latescibacteria bacterium]|nr:glycerol-3-phosphate cytidylyltransferase [Candidatus Latescibacterota bacterium]